LNSIGTDANTVDIMTIFPYRENGIKASVRSRPHPFPIKSQTTNLTTPRQVFRPEVNNIDSKFSKSNKAYDAQRGTCSLGRLVVVYKYMAKNETQQRL